MHHICDLFENHIERPTKNETTNKLKWKTVFRFVSVSFSVYGVCVCMTSFSEYIYCAIRMGPLSLIHEQSHCLEIRNYVYFFICWNFVGFYQVMHDTVCYYYYSIFIVMLLLYGITLLYDNGTFQHDLVETDRNLKVTRKKRTLYYIEPTDLHLHWLFGYLSKFSSDSKILIAHKHFVALWISI